MWVRVRVHVQTVHMASMKKRNGGMESVTDEMQNYVVQQKHEQHKLQSGLLNTQISLAIYVLVAFNCVCVCVLTLCDTLKMNRVRFQFY